jgi:membrane associated rhomboid family serine protease
MYAVIILAFGMVMRGVDNFAHVGGFIGGFLGGVVLNPLKRETFGTLVAALACLALTVLSIAASVLTA